MKMKIENENENKKVIKSKKYFQCFLFIMRRFVELKNSPLLNDFGTKLI